MNLLNYTFNYVVKNISKQKSSLNRLKLINRVYFEQLFYPKG